MADNHNQIVTKTKTISIITYIDNVDMLDNHIKSIVSNSLYKSGNIEVILINPDFTAETYNYCERIVGVYENLKCFHINHISQADGYNLGILHSSGLYLNFSLASSFFERDTFEHIFSAIKDSKYISLVAMAPWTVNEVGIYCKYRISPSIFDGKMKEISLEKNPCEVMLCLQGFLIKKTSIIKADKTELFVDLGYDTSMNYIMRMMCEEKKYLYVSYAFYHYTVPLEDNTSAYLGQYSLGWYMETMQQSLLSLLEKYGNDGKIPVYLQKMVLWSLFSRFNCNYNDRNKGIINEDTLSEFYDKASHVLKYIDDICIWKKEKKQSFTIPRTIRFLLLNIKDGNYGLFNDIYMYKGGLWKATRYDLNIESEEKTISEECDVNVISEIVGEDKLESIRVNKNGYFTEINDGKKKTEKPLKICDLKKEHIIIDVINYENERLIIDGRCSISDFNLDTDVNVYVKYKNQFFSTKTVDIYKSNKIFGETYNKKMRFQAELYTFSLNDEFDISFWVNINGIMHRLMIKTGSIYAHISSHKGAYWRFSKNEYAYLNKDNAIIISKGNDSRFEELEKSFCAELESENTEYSLKALEIRKQYFERKKYKKKPIWVSFDKLYKAGDNGEYMYHYIKKNAPNIEMFYLIKEDAPDYQRLMDEDAEHILVWGKDETIVTMLLADVILATHANVVSNAGIEKTLIPYLTGLFNPINICIQHGLTVQNIAQYQNRIFDNTRFYVLASPNEFRNINTPIYGYEKEQLRITGVARYDGLKSKAKKQILITPTWRRNVANSNIAHFKKAHNLYFKNSEYFRLYNTLINDERLIKCAKENGYQLIYLMHPAASSQIEDFDRNDYVKIIPAAGDMNYEKILTESSLMVTDYSGIQFDFAYMKKPILYYHPSTLPPHYDESEAYKYNRDSFGPVIKEHKELIDSLCEYMKNNCVMLDEYKDRVDRFFEFHDFNNCERIYSAILEFVKDKVGD